jgi:hypothetical protein
MAKRFTLRKISLPFKRRNGGEEEMGDTGPDRSEIHLNQYGAPRVCLTPKGQDMADLEDLTENPVGHSDTFAASLTFKENTTQTCENSGLKTILEDKAEEVVQDDKSHAGENNDTKHLKLYPMVSRLYSLFRFEPPGMFTSFNDIVFSLDTLLFLLEERNKEDISNDIRDLLKGLCEEKRKIFIKSIKDYVCAIKAGEDLDLDQFRASARNPERLFAKEEPIPAGSHVGDKGRGISEEEKRIDEKILILEELLKNRSPEENKVVKENEMISQDFLKREKMLQREIMDLKNDLKFRNLMIDAMGQRISNKKNSEILYSKPYVNECLKRGRELVQRIKQECVKEFDEKCRENSELRRKNLSLNSKINDMECVIEGLVDKFKKEKTAICPLNDVEQNIKDNEK